MPHSAANPSVRSQSAHAIIADLNSLTLALSDTEYEVARILAFDPEAQLAPGTLIANSDNICSDFDARNVHVAADLFATTIWQRLARACSDWTRQHDDTSCLATFLAERSVQPDGDGPRDPAVPVQPDDKRVCLICDGGPGNDCACLCGARKYEAAPVLAQP